MTVTSCGSGNSINNGGSIPDNIKNITDFGAIGNGTTDNTQAIQTGLNWLSTNGGTLIFPKGIYKVGKQLDLPLLYNSVLKSPDGDDATILMDTSESSAVKTILNIFGTRTNVGTLTQSIAKNSLILSGNFPDVNPGDELIIVGDKPNLANATLSFSSLDTNSLTQLTTDTAFFTPQMVGQSIVFPVNNKLLDKTIPGNDIIIKLNEPNTGATAVIAQYISPTSAVAIVGNNNDIPANTVPAKLWGIITLWDQARGYYVKGEIVKVDKKSQDQIILTSPLIDDYVQNNATLYKISNNNVSISGLNFRAAEKSGLINRKYSADNGLLVNDLASFNIKNSQIYNLNNIGIFINECGSGVLDSIIINNIMKLNSRYGILIAQSQNILVNNANLSSGSHAFATGGTFPNRHITVMNTIINDDSNDYAFDFHGNVSDVLIDNVRSLGGFLYSGANIQIKNSSFLSSYNNPTGFAEIAATIYPEVSGNSIEFNNSTFISSSYAGLLITPAFINIDLQNQPNNLYGVIESISINNSQIVSPDSTTSGALTMHSNNYLPFNMGFNNLFISNSLVIANKTFGIYVSYQSPVNLNLKNFNIMNNSSIVSDATSSIYMNLGLQDNYLTTMLIDNSVLSAHGNIGVNLNNIDNINIQNSQLNGNAKSQIMQIFGFNNLEILNNLFINWYGISDNSQLLNMLNSTSNVDPKRESSMINYNDNLVIQR